MKKFTPFIWCFLLFGATLFGQTAPDIAVSISAPATYQKYTALSFTLTAKNVGNVNMQNVEVTFDQPAFTSNGGQAVASLGQYQEYCAGGIRCLTWTIPVLGIGQSATLVIPLYVLDPGGVALSGRVQLHGSSPMDTNAGNNSGVAIVQAPGSGGGCRQSDSLVLVDFYNTITGFPKLPWDLHQPMSTWFFVHLDANVCVDSLNFQFQFLQGTIPNSMGSLSHLKFLDLHYNLLSGSIPSSLGNLSELTYLSLYNNGLSGSIPSSLGNLKKLKVLGLGVNGLNGTIPSSIANLSQLERLDIYNNRLIGQIPSSLGNLSQLKNLDLSVNQLNGPIPRSLSNLSQLGTGYPPQFVSLNLSGNQLSGCLPAELKKLCRPSLGVNISYNPGLPNGGDWTAFCNSGAGACTSGGTDIAIDNLVSDKSAYSKFTNLTFTTTAKNVGSTAATNIQIQFKIPTNTSYGGIPTATVGAYQEYCAGGAHCQIWTIPSLAMGASASLSVPVFVLDPVGTGINATSTLLSSTPIDGNASNDTKTIVVPPTAGAFAILYHYPTQGMPVVIQKIYPTPTEEVVVVEVESIMEGSVGFEFFSSLGTLVKREIQPVTKGANRHYFDLTELSSGIYWLGLSGGSIRNMPVKVVKF